MWLACTDLKTSNGGWISDRAAIGGNFISHFFDLFSSSSPPIDDELPNLVWATITKDDDLSLCLIPSEAKVIQALSSLGSTKALGLDGFTTLFYKKKYRPTVRRDVLDCVWNFFHNKHLLREHNHTYIVLVPKQSGSRIMNLVSKFEWFYHAK